MSSDSYSNQPRKPQMGVSLNLKRKRNQKGAC